MTASYELAELVVGGKAVLKKREDKSWGTDLDDSIIGVPFYQLRKLERHAGSRWSTF